MTLILAALESGTTEPGTTQQIGTVTAIAIALLLVLLNGFFVAAEFALVKVRKGQIDQMIRDRRPFARTSMWLADRMDQSLSTCQLGITMASLALGWIGEPAFHYLLQPLFDLVRIPDNLAHVFAFLVAFSLITALHLVFGEQAPKIYAIREPERTLTWCALPMKMFYILLYPLQATLSWVTSRLLTLMGVGGDGHGSVMTEEEIRAMLTEAHSHGELTRAEHSLINAVFEFDDKVCRRVMLPKSDVVYFSTENSLRENLQIARRTKHTRYPLCEGNLDDTIGVVHIKDLTGISPEDEFDLKAATRPPHKIPESMPISRLLRQFQATHQLMAFVVDEFGNTIGIVTLENVLEQIIGPVDDEFDEKEAPIVPQGKGVFIVQGSTPIREVEKVLRLNLDDQDVDTLSGVLMDRSQKMPSPGDRIEFDGAVAEILEVRDDRADRVRFTLTGRTDISS
jgi:CBS domain containing-hemolysin-like protein